jgi:two-component system response regulator PilR (NtrC family)
MVSEGRFREDLFYRINVIELRVPSLRERVDDIPDLAEAILNRLCRRMKMETPEFSVDAMEALKNYPFPGNVRELENILERAITLSTTGVILPEHIKLRAPVVPSSLMPAALVNSSASSGMSALGDQLEDIERDAIVKALEQTRYNKTAAAKLLGMSFRALRYRIKKLNIE